MLASTMFAAIGSLFFVAALWNVRRDKTADHPQTRTWLLVAGVFCAVSGWLFYRM